MEKREPSCIVGGNVNWYSHYGKQYGGSLKIKLPCNPEIPEVLNQKGFNDCYLLSNDSERENDKSNVAKC